MKIFLIGLLVCLTSQGNALTPSNKIGVESFEDSIKIIFDGKTKTIDARLPIVFSPDSTFCAYTTWENFYYWNVYNHEGTKVFERSILASQFYLTDDGRTIAFAIEGERPLYSKKSTLKMYDKTGSEIKVDFVCGVQVDVTCL